MNFIRLRSSAHSVRSELRRIPQRVSQSLSVVALDKRSESFKKTPLYKRAKRRVPRRIQAIVLAISMITPVNALGWNFGMPYEQEFVITAYYSPLPDQCCYVKGGYDADKYLNGEGHTAADGTPVSPGLIAAPPLYAFGTAIKLPGIGTFKVHDRGGAIQVLEDGTHRLDIWVGYGEEGLSRALEFGVQRITGTVYPNGSQQPGVDFVLRDLDAPVEKVRPYLLAGTDLLDVRPKVDDINLSVTMLQEHLRDSGYFSHAITGKFGSVTQEALAAFNRDFGIDEPNAQLSERSASYLLAAARRSGARNPVDGYVDPESAGSLNAQAQRILRFLGYYTGRTDGAYEDPLKGAIFDFQQDHWLVGDWGSPGAGRIGPITTRTLTAQWNKKLVEQRAKRYLALRNVEKHLDQHGMQIAQFLEEGNYGRQVELLQTLLAERGYFPFEKINGNFGPLTRESVLMYQMKNGLISSADQTGAGVVGPGTLAKLRTEEKIELYKLVRSEGWHVL